MDQNMKKLLVLIGGLVALLVICIVVVGMVDGFWPWQNQTEGSTGVETTTLDQSQSTGETTLETTQDTTAETTGETTEETGGNSGGNGGGGNSGGNGGGGNSGGNSGDIEIPINPEKPGPGIGVEEGEDPTEELEPDEDNQDENYTGDKDGYIDFDDLLGN